MAAQIRAVLMVVLINFHKIIKTIQATINVIIITLGIEKGKSLPVEVG